MLGQIIASVTPPLKRFFQGVRNAHDAVDGLKIFCNINVDSLMMLSPRKSAREQVPRLCIIPMNPLVLDDILFTRTTVWWLPSPLADVHNDDAACTYIPCAEVVSGAVHR